MKNKNLITILSLSMVISSGYIYAGEKSEIISSELSIEKQYDISIERNSSGAQKDENQEVATGQSGYTGNSRKLDANQESDIQGEDNLENLQLVDKTQTDTTKEGDNQINNSQKDNNQESSSQEDEGEDSLEEITTEPNGSGKIILTLNEKEAIVEGVQVELISPPTIINNTTLLPLRFIGDQVLQATTNWDPETKTVTVIKDDTVVVVTIGSSKATIDGMEVELAVPPQIIDNITLLPLRFMSEAFGIPIEYNSAEKTITLTKLSEEPEIVNTPPVASFYFPETYIAGQVVTAVDTSSDPDGDEIKNTLWSVGGIKTVTNRVLSNMFKTPRAGTYTVGLKVQDTKGAWSEWTYQIITIEQNMPPTITTLETDRHRYAQGEEINLNYTYDNEAWETVNEGKWTYRPIGEDASKATPCKPERIFTPGEYIISLYLDDAYGNRSLPMETTITITDKKLISELEYHFTKGENGDWVDNFQNENYLSYKPLTPISTTYDSGTLIMSDSPEVVTGPGILYEDIIDGRGSLLIHHIHGIKETQEKQRLVVIMENTTEDPVVVTLKNRSIKGPSVGVLRVGQLALKEYFEGSPIEIITLEPGEKKYLYDRAWELGSCISGHIDLETTGPVNFITANMGESYTFDSLKDMVYFPADGSHYSGTYDTLGIRHTLRLDGDTLQRFTLGAPNSGEWIKGYDQRTMTVVENAGNFGITHYVTVTATEDTGVILNNRGGTFRGVIKWEDGETYNMPGTGSFNGTTSKAVVMGVIRKGETRTFEYLLPNGSAAPTLIGFIPKSYW